jgi:hypothetical protein
MIMTIRHPMDTLGVRSDGRGCATDQKFLYAHQYPALKLTIERWFCASSAFSTADRTAGVGTGEGACASTGGVFRRPVDRIAPKR